MGKVRTVLACSECGQQLAQWAGRCPGCGAWGTIDERRRAPGTGSEAAVERLSDAHVGGGAARIPTGSAGTDRVLGGGLMPASVVLLAGEPGIGKSTLLLQLVSNLSNAGFPCLLASGEESLEQVAARARRLRVTTENVDFVSGRDLGEVLRAARSVRPSLLAVDSIQTIRDAASPSLPGGPAQVRGCLDELLGLAKADGVTIIVTGHVTKEGEVAGPRTLEHAVDVVLTFDGDPRSGLRMLSGGKNRFGLEGESAWFEMERRGLREIQPTSFLSDGVGQPGAAVALPLAGRRGLAVEVQALVAPTEGPARRQATGLDARRFQLVAAVLDRAMGLPLSRSELYGATAGGLRVQDPGCDLAVAAALASSCMGAPAPTSSAFVGEVALTGQVRPVPGMPQRLSAARRAGIRSVFAPPSQPSETDLRIVPTTNLRDALGWAQPGHPSSQ